MGPADDAGGAKVRVRGETGALSGGLSGTSSNALRVTTHGIPLKQALLSTSGRELTGVTIAQVDEIEAHPPARRSTSPCDTLLLSRGDSGKRAFRPVGALPRDPTAPR